MQRHPACRQSPRLSSEVAKQIQPSAQSVHTYKTQCQGNSGFACEAGARPLLCNAGCIINGSAAEAIAMRIAYVVALAVLSGALLGVPVRADEKEESRPPAENKATEDDAKT